MGKFILKEKKKNEESKKIIEEGLNKGDPESMYIYSKMLIKGEGCEKDIEKAIHYLIASKDKGFHKSEIILNALEESNKTKPFELFKFLDEEDLNHLHIIREIGSGSGGHVYEIVDETNQSQHFALKVMNTSDINVSKLRGFIGEYEKICFLNHPNIVTAHGIFMGNETKPPSILLDFCSKDLNQIVRDKSLSNVDVALIVYEIAEAFRYIHSRSIIHRDIKPSNILIDSDKHIKVSDFGISKLMTIDEQSTTLGAGTQKFISPEILNENGYDTKSDVYSFGVLLFFIVSGGDMPRITVVHMGNGHKAEIPNEFTSFARSLIDRCWNLDPKTRPSFIEIVREMNAKNYKIVELNDEEVIEVRKRVNEHKKRIPKYF